MLFSPLYLISVIFVEFLTLPISTKIKMFSKILLQMMNANLKYK